MNRRREMQRFMKEVWGWYRQHKRVLPWRDLTIIDDSERAYRVLVSEIMLQQTQVPRVIGVYERFLKEFPTLQALAYASNRKVLVAWRGMGYNSRALRLRDAARIIVEKFKREFPTDVKTLCSIKGIGNYTAAAIRNFAFNLPTPCLDTNIRRVLHLAFVGPPKRDGTWRVSDTVLLKLAEEVLRVALSCCTPAEWHSALMDYGALVLKGPSGKPRRRIEPGRRVGGKFIPNRIFRGRIVEELRAAPTGLTLPALGKHVAPGWNPRLHRVWLQEVLSKLERDRLVAREGRRWLLR